MNEALRIHLDDEEADAIETIEVALASAEARTSDLAIRKLRDELSGPG